MPERAVSEAVRRRVHSLVNPPISRVAAKFVACHFVAAIGVITICPQLGVGPFIGGHGLMHVFMRFGPVVCALLCGALFLAASFLLSSGVLTVSELRVARRHELIHVSLMGAISLAGLILLGARETPLIYALWIAGALLGGLAALRLGVFLRRQAHPYFGI